MFLEKDLEKKFCETAKALGFYPVKFTDPARRGAPDRIVFGPMGLTFFVEFKRAGFEPTMLQIKYHAFLRDMGFNVFTCDDFSQIQDILDQYAF